MKKKLKDVRISDPTSEEYNIIVYNGQRFFIKLSKNLYPSAEVTLQGDIFIVSDEQVGDQRVIRMSHYGNQFGPIGKIKLNQDDKVCSLNVILKELESKKMKKEIKSSFDKDISAEKPTNSRQHNIENWKKKYRGYGYSDDYDCTGLEYYGFTKTYEIKETELIPLSNDSFEEHAEKIIIFK